MIEPGQKLIRYVGGMAPRVVDVVFVEDGQAVTSDQETINAETLESYEDDGDRYELATPSNIAQAKQFERGMAFCSTFHPMQFVHLTWRPRPVQVFS